MSTNQATEGVQVLNAKEAAELLRVSMTTMTMLLRTGKIPAVKVGREWRLSRSALEDFLAGKTQEQREGEK